jgi:hypothetical protein
MGPTDWTAVSQPPFVTNGLNTVTLALPSGHQSFRLKRQ